MTPDLHQAGEVRLSGQSLPEVVVNDTRSVRTPAQKLLSARARAPSVRVAEATRSWSWQAATPNAGQLAIDSPGCWWSLGCRNDRRRDSGGRT
ncbi:MAG: hypothetical protein ABT940_06255 [Alphaproteobacteria bacterium]